MAKNYKGKPPSAGKPPARNLIRDPLSVFLTQKLVDKSIRIRRAVEPDELARLIDQVVEAWLKKQEEQRQAAPRRAEPALEGAETFYDKQMALMAKVATGLWRLRKRMLKPGTDEPLDEMKRAYRQVESVWDALHEAGYKVIDHTNTPYTEGLELRVIHYGQREGIDHEVISETVMPSILFEGTRIQEGEVYVDYPADSPTDPTPGAPLPPGPAEI
jgi:hypothetical protein